MSDVRSRWWLFLVLVGVAILAWFPRSVEGLKHPYTHDGTEWFSRDPDGLYHARRVERAMDEGFVAETDPRMNFPHGARIPWPPYYDALLARVLAPFAPESVDARHAWIERTVSSAPRLFGVIAVVLTACAAWRLSGLGAALVAGATIALCRGTINYSVIGTGDHHAWIAMLAAASLVCLSEALRRASLESTRRSLLWGVLLGLICGVMIGSWVASLVHVVFLQAALGWMLFRRSRIELRGLASLGLALHVTAVLVILPAALASPWRAEFPWMAVNLSWFHVAQLMLGAAVFVPLAWRGQRELSTGTRAARWYPISAGATLAAIAALAWAFDLAPARGLREGFEWISRVDAFMDTVLESRALIGANAEPGVLFLALGYSITVLPIALAIAAWVWVRQGRDELAPWILATAVLVPMALGQRRFADALAAPMAVVLGVGVMHFVPSGRRAWSVGLGSVAFAAAIAAQYPSASSAWRGLTRARAEHIAGPSDVFVAEREALAWISRRVDGAPDWSVLAHWDRGHTIEWAARAPTVATNFGSYIGIESYRDVPSFFLHEVPSEARAILQRRKVRFVYVPTWIINVTSSMCRVAAPDRRDALLLATPNGGVSVTERWFGTLAGRLLFGGVPVAPSGATIGVETAPLEYLRLVYVSRQRDPRFLEPMTRLPMPCVFLWEHVEGALVSISGSPGDTFEIEFDVDFAERRYRVPWRARTTVDPNGTARVRVPYSTEAGSSDGRVLNARWRMGARSGELVVSEHAVTTGALVELP